MVVQLHSQTIDRQGGLESRSADIHAFIQGQITILRELEEKKLVDKVIEAYEAANNQSGDDKSGSSSSSEYVTDIRVLNRKIHRIDAILNGRANPPIESMADRLAAVDRLQLTEDERNQMLKFTEFAVDWLNRQASA